MVRLTYITIFNTNVIREIQSNKHIMIYSELYLATKYGFFERTTVRDVCIFALRQRVRKCSKGPNKILNYMGYDVYIHML